MWWWYLLGKYCRANKDIRIFVTTKLSTNKTTICIIYPFALSCSALQAIVFFQLAPLFCTICCPRHSLHLHWKCRPPLYSRLALFSFDRVAPVSSDLFLQIIAPSMLYAYLNVQVIFIVFYFIIFNLWSSIKFIFVF